MQQLSQMSRRMRRLVEWLGVTGTTARGGVFALAGAGSAAAPLNFGVRRARRR
jgi:hypothetical protein